MTAAPERERPERPGEPALVGKLRARQAEQSLIGKRLDAAAVAAAQTVVGDDLDPPEDEHVPPAMKRHLARVLLGRLLGEIMRQEQ